MKIITAQFRMRQHYKTYTVTYIEAIKQWHVWEGLIFIFRFEETREHYIKTDERAKQILRMALFDATVGKRKLETI